MCLAPIIRPEVAKISIAQGLPWVSRNKACFAPKGLWTQPRVSARDPSPRRRPEGAAHERNYPTKPGVVIWLNCSLLSPLQDELC